MYDSGNALAESPQGPMGKFPYGVTIHHATGRFTDGYTIIDRIARREHVESSLFVLGGAGNDYLHMNLSFSSLPRVVQMKRIMPALLAATRAYVKTLITEYGARKLVVPGILKAGCRVSTGGFFHATQVQCDETLISVAALHNRLLKRELEMLRIKFPDVEIVYGDMWRATQWLFDHFGSAGIHHPNERCCGNSSIGCGMPGAPYCGNPSDYIDWDGTHFTDHAYRLMSDFLIPQLASGLGCRAAAAAAANNVRSQG
ncbi:unnamed protein product [Linum tenue]|uniref:Uncharacterized protein n=1 Tax=Linum tenue TaxID=586396 RepID=A0AAV0I6J4_9ROSI|nr:unnamed protein product [Linum tenue]